MPHGLTCLAQSADSECPIRDLSESLLWHTSFSLCTAKQTKVIAMHVLWTPSFVRVNNSIVELVEDARAGWVLV